MSKFSSLRHVSVSYISKRRPAQNVGARENIQLRSRLDVSPPAFLKFAGTRKNLPSINRVMEGGWREWRGGKGDGDAWFVA